MRSRDDRIIIILFLQLRLMDSLEAEQARGITMKSSAVSLVHEKGIFVSPIRCFAIQTVHL